MLCIFIRIDLEDLADAVIVIPLLQEFLFVCRRVAFNEIL